MANGCICCTFRDDLLEEIHKMLQAHEGIEVVMVEGSGIAEPLPIAEAFAASEKTGGHVSRAVRLDTLVTVVDSDKFLSDFESREQVGDRKDLRDIEGASAADARSIVDLLVQQVETADVIVLNKADLLDARRLLRLRALVSSLNPAAKLVESTYSRVPLHHILNTGLFDIDRFLKKHQVVVEELELDDQVEHADTKAEREYRIKSFSYTAPRPFHPQRLAAWLSREFEAMRLHVVVRSKGFVRIADRTHRQGYWSHAGRNFAIEIEEALVSENADKDRVVSKPINEQDDDAKDKKDGQEQEERKVASQIVFIGVAMNEPKMREALDACVLTEQEHESRELFDDTAMLPFTKSKDDDQVVQRQAQRKWIEIARRLAYFTILYNVIEGVISIILGVDGESLSLIGFGADSFIETFSALVVFWRWRSDTNSSVQQKKRINNKMVNGQNVGSKHVELVEHDNHHGRDNDDNGTEHSHDDVEVGLDAEFERELERERRATLAIGVALLVLGLSALGASIAQLASEQHPESTVAGIVVSSLSLSFMVALWYWKNKAAYVLDSRTLQIDASCSLGCIQLSGVLLVGSVLFTVWDGFWWVDGVAAIIIAVLILIEGKNTVAHASDKQRWRESGGGCGCGEPSSSSSSSDGPGSAGLGGISTNALLARKYVLPRLERELISQRLQRQQQLVFLENQADE
eukprot:TRINITY_DN66533_c7_g1_i2.p1 TRINITY_DN66533_c7_g1~~TRINITY_DN66533_c7_g1_i2.p1  ORF type:complete len:758 (+),score=471.29 TRINITY_DN66533_c7_g1_i2:203-2275(+)